MEALAILRIPFAVLAGFLVAVYGFRQVTVWLFYSWSQLKPEHGRRSVAAFLVAFFLSPGLWLLIVLAVVSSYFSSSWWAPWSIAGVAAGAIYILAITAVVKRKMKKASNERAA